MEVIEVVERDSCLTCARLLECSATSDTCDAIAELKQAEVGLGILEKMDKAKSEKTT